jgi:DNA-binding CsgD family transcriptional regulator
MHPRPNVTEVSRVASVENFNQPLADAARRWPTQSSTQTLAADLFAALLDHIDLGVMVCDAECRLLHANCEAQAELERGRLLAVAGKADQRSTFVHAAGGVVGAQALQAAVHCAARQGRRRMVSLHAGDDRLLVNAMPLACNGGEPLVLLLLGSRDLCSPLGLEMLASLHGLTSAERRVTAGLASGLNAAEIAAEAGVAISTLRSQISTVRAKLGARSVDHLLFRVAGVPRMAGALQRSGAPWRAAA